jgi:hypothetical protein
MSANLKDIKDLLLINAVDFNLDKEDVRFLILQAEKVEEYERSLTKIRKNVWDLSNQNAVIASKVLEKFNA